jgi:hypothetical protein
VVLHVLVRWVLELTTTSTAIFFDAEWSTKRWTLPSPVSMTGTLAFWTTDWIRPCPPRGMRTSTFPRAAMSAFAPSRPYSSTLWTQSTGSFTSARESRMMPTRARLDSSAAEPPRSSTALPDFRAIPAMSTVTLGRAS